MIEIRNLFHEGGSPADLRYKEEERKRTGEIAEKTAREECTLDWSQSKVFLVCLAISCPANWSAIFTSYIFTQPLYTCDVRQLPVCLYLF